MMLADKHVKTRKSGNELTSIVAAHNRPHHLRRDDEQIRDPAPAVRRRATGNADDVVTPRLHDVVEEHLQRREASAPQQVDRISSPPLALGESQAHSLSIHDLSQRSQHARHRARHSNGHGDRDLDFDVAEHVPIEPVLNVVVGPKDGVEEVLQVEDEEPEDE